MRKSALYVFGLVVTALVALGFVVLMSASGKYGLRIYGDSLYFVKRQAAYIVFGICVAFIMAKIDYHRWRDQWGFTAFAFVAVLIMLLAVFAFREVKGSHRWLVLGPIRMQPGEFAKIITVIAVSVWMDKAAWRVELFMRGAFWPFVIIGLMAAPVLKEPDFGSVMVIAAVGVLVMFVAGTRILHALPFCLVGVGVVIMHLLTNENRMRRLKAFFSLCSSSDAASTAASTATAAAASVDPAAYQAQMALVAIKNGGVFGVGLNNSMQKWLYLPEAHTDFIFAIGAEELGIFFSIGVLLLYLTFFGLSVYIARKATDRLGRFFVIGMAFIIFFQAMFNLGVVCEALPTKGMALPFFSYGGTNLVASFIAVGMILSVGIHSYRDKKRVLRRSVLV